MAEKAAQAHARRRKIAVVVVLSIIAGLAAVFAVRAVERRTRIIVDECREAVSEFEDAAERLSDSVAAADQLAAIIEDDGSSDALRAEGADVEGFTAALDRAHGVIPEEVPTACTGRNTARATVKELGPLTEDTEEAAARVEESTAELSKRFDDYRIAVASDRLAEAEEQIDAQIELAQDVVTEADLEPGFADDPQRAEQIDDVSNAVRDARKVEIPSDLAGLQSGDIDRIVGDLAFAGQGIATTQQALTDTLEAYRLDIAAREAARQAEEAARQAEQQADDLAEDQPASAEGPVDQVESGDGQSDESAAQGELSP